MGVLRDSKSKGHYEKSDIVPIQNKDLTILLLEAALYATPEGKGTLGVMISSPAFFPFQFSSVTGDLISQRVSRIEVVRYGLDEELLKLGERK